MGKEAKVEIRELVAKYEEVKTSGKLKSYTEEQTKKDFILPLFEILGWDVYSSKDVSAEEHIKSSGRVDYGFYMNDRIKFYLEAKKFNVDLYSEDFAHQAIRYSFNKGATWAVLTNFETLIVFNAQDITGNLSDKRFFTINYNEYLEKFDRLCLLSKEAFENDLLDKEAEKYGKKIERVPISSLLYKDLQNCREILIKDLSQWNKNVSSDDLDEGVQKILDRLLFIRVAEDRGVEPATLIPMVREFYSRKGEQKETIYQMMVKKFRELDVLYNSNLFSTHFFEEWKDYSGVTKDVIGILYGKEGYYEYDFKAMPSDVLGAVYENYLSHRLSKSKKGTTVAKDAGKRKEQGIYYTPSYIVDYIVKNALGPVLDRCHSIRDIKNIKVLDPACGSGSFLIKAVDIIAEKYKSFGYKNEEWLKRQIIDENIYGVDLDPQAVEITRLNLLINALTERAKFSPLKNIKNGNSLISGTDEQLEKYFGKNFRDKKPFNWQEEFPEVFAQGGFDVIIGNPPYIRVDSLDESDKDLWKNCFKSARGKYDIYYLFIEKSISLLKDTGNLGFIIPNKFCVAESGKELRSFIFDSSTIAKFFSVSKIDVFKDASNYPVILFAKKGKAEDEVGIGFANSEEDFLNQNFTDYIISKKDLAMLPSQIIPVDTEKNIVKLVINLISKNKKLGNYLKISEGLRIPEKYESEEKREFGIVKQYQFSKYSTISGGSYISSGDLAEVVSEKSERFKNSQKNKIVIAEDALFITATIDINKNIPQGGVYFATLTEKDVSINFLLGLLNSKLLSFVYQTLYGGMHMGGGYMRYRTAFLEKLPVEIGREKQVADLVGRMLKLNKDLQKTTENTEKWDSIKAEIEKTDKKIDQEVYKLYGLTEAEIKIVENN